MKKYILLFSLVFLVSCNEIAEMQQEWNETKTEISTTIEEVKNFNPLQEVKNEITETTAEVQQTIDAVKNFDVSEAVSREINEAKQEIAETMSVENVMNEIFE